MPRHPGHAAVGAIFACALASGLAACNETDPGLGAPQTALVSPGPASPLRLPPGAPCAGEISRFQAVVSGDFETGNVQRKVYDEIEGDLSRAANACSAGRGGEAHAIVAATKARHGYRA